MSQDYDVVIAGGGMVGASLAVALSRQLGQRLRIAIVEGFPMPKQASAPVYQPSFDARSTALAAGARQVFEHFGIWQTLAEHAQPIEQIHVSRRSRPGSMVMEAQRERLDALGYVVENQWLGRVLLAAVQQCDNVEFLCPATVESVTPQAAGNRVDVKDKATGEFSALNAKLVVIADGADSPLAQSLGIRYQRQAYQASALVANISTAKPHQGWAYERFSSDGPMAMLPLTDGPAGERRSALVWSRPEGSIDNWLSCPEQEFLAALQRQFGYRLGKLLAVGQRFSYPLQLVEASEQVRSGLVVMGNAAHLLHPVAGQGFNLALRDVVALTRTIDQAQHQREDWSSLKVLLRYQQAQRDDQWLTTSFSDRLPGLFSSPSAALSMATSLGLSALDLSSGLKNSFVRHAAGIQQTQDQMMGMSDAQY
ncbi:2-octaprenyl-6-methoxyphenol hydroxylase [Sinobacterium caligoides]|uniref:2-octaprenyl-6-methoxyphenol hydroxylase n=1 Tax=Sinobacterium caligoides TaxID=933926 RepID=A0A3N2DGD2_9GAMM|nr:2-octaprenyl-6-methoxyphenyl hydroxylase [Sinobacterium caligoides]ROR98856.1 2-octaprenyl-6-methoxyphenol hydroxylase [Sinobacterium caligoides]